MPVSIAHIDQLLPDASVEDLLLLRAARTCILPPAHSPPQWAVSGLDWTEVGKVATRNKMAVLLLRGLNRGAGDAPQDFRTALEAQ